LNRKE